jgi:hypothetical protein
MFPLIAAIAFCFAALMYAAYDARPSDIVAVQQSRIDALTSAIIVYHDALTTYAIANVATTGTIPDISLALPTWFVNPGLTNHILATGTVRTWLPSGATALSEQSDLLYALHARLQGYSNSGRVASGGYFNAAQGYVADAISVQNIPANATLLFTKVR